MGTLRFVLAQVAISALVVGALKRKGAVTYRPEAISNDYARYAVTWLISTGESAWVKGAELMEQMTQKPR